MARILTVLIMLVAMHGTAAAANPRLVIASLEIESADDTAVDAATRAFARELTVALELRARSGEGPYQLVSNSAMELAYPECANYAPSCMAPRGVHQRAAVLIYGEVRRVGPRYQVTVVLLNVATKAIIRALAETVLADDATGPVAPGPLASRFSKRLYPKLVTGKVVSTIVVTGGYPHADLTINGVRVDMVDGVARLPNRAPGRYVLALTVRGITTKQTVTVGNDGEEVIAAFKVAFPRIGIAG